MSTQRREGSGQLTDWLKGAGVLWQICLAPLALLLSVANLNRTAPPEFPARLATKSLLSDHRFHRFDRQSPRDFRRGSPPARVGWALAAVASVPLGSSRSSIVSPAVCFPVFCLS